LKRLLGKEYPDIDDRKLHREYGIIKVGDELRVRVYEERLKFDK
jgi:hypothetical protein